MHFVFMIKSFFMVRVNEGKNVPHCIIEHSQTLMANSLLDAVHQVAINSALFQSDDIKSRAIAYEHYFSAKQGQNFVHVTVKILSGRELAQRSHLSEMILQALRQLNLTAVSLTVEVVEIERASYAKLVVK